MSFQAGETKLERFTTKNQHTQRESDFFQTAPDFVFDPDSVFFFSAVSVNPNDQPVIFHRGHVVWDAKSFGRDYKLVAPTLIGEDTIVTLDADSGKPLSSFGKDLFLMPHGLTVDNEGNIYVTDVGLHQVMRVSYFFDLLNLEINFSI